MHCLRHVLGKQSWAGVQAAAAASVLLHHTAGYCTPRALPFVPWAPTVKAVLIDAAGTLLVPTEPAANVYLRYASKYGVNLTEREVLDRFRRAYNTPWGHSRIRYVGDGRPFWRHIVSEATGCSNEHLFEEVYGHYGRADAWRLAPGASPALAQLRALGVKLAVVSNFDTRLKPILDGLRVGSLFQEVVVSAEVGAEKPNPVIFEAALSRLGLPAEDVLHVGDDRRNDVWGARDAGIRALLWGVDVTSFDQLVRMVLLGKLDALDLEDSLASMKYGSLLEPQHHQSRGAVAYGQR